MSDAPQLQVPDLESIPSSRAVTLRNLTTGRGVTASGQPTATRRARHWRWWTAAAAFTFALFVIWLARGPRDPAAAGPVPSELAVRPSATGAVPPSNSAPPEPKPVLLDDLPAEPTGHRVSRPDASKRPAGGGTLNSKRGAGDPFARGQ